MHTLIRNLGRISHSLKFHQDPFISSISKRFYPQPRKRFYAQVDVVEDDGQFGITLDSKRLKTPNKKPLKIGNKALALMISDEWASQSKIIEPHSMHLTGLLNTSIDNPNKKGKQGLVEEICNSLTFDVLFYPVEDEKLGKLQREQWDPIVSWFEKEFDIKFNLVPGSISPPEISELFRKRFISYLNSYSVECLHGLAFANATINSIILSLAALNDIITTEEAVRLSRLETEFQIHYWGNVEWAHDLTLQDTIARFSSAIVYIDLHLKSPFCEDKSKAKC